MNQILPQTSPRFAPPEILTMDGRADIAGWNLDEIACAIAPLDGSAMRARQLYQWIYGRGERDFSAMTNLAKPFRARLAEKFVIGRANLVNHQISRDGTQKFLLGLSDQRHIEAVFIPEPNRGTLCVSSQIGCTLNCRFCHTGRQRLERNLSAAEIVQQVLVARDILGEWEGLEDRRIITNIVLMGMGEPLYNFDQVAKAVRLIMDDCGLNFSRRRITLSTAGVVPMIERCGTEIGVQLAISLHATRDDLRSQLVPLNRKYPIAELLDACRNYPGLRRGQRITFEYIMLRDVNDRIEDAKTLVRLIKGIPAKINLIPFNPWPGSTFLPSHPKIVERFADIVREAGYPSPVRRPRGDDIMAACGQLYAARQAGDGTA